MVYVFSNTKNNKDVNQGKWIPLDIIQADIDTNKNTRYFFFYILSYLC